MVENYKPWWWKPLWIAVILSSIALEIVGYFLWHVPLERLVGGVALTFLCIGIAYYIRIKPSMKVNRALYIVLGASGTELIILFGGAWGPRDQLFYGNIYEIRKPLHNSPQPVPK